MAPFCTNRCAFAATTSATATACVTDCVLGRCRRDGVWIGNSPNSTGRASVRGAGSTWSGAGQFIVGYRRRAGTQCRRVAVILASSSRSHSATENIGILSLPLLRGRRRKVRFVPAGIGAITHFRLLLGVKRKL